MSLLFPLTLLLAVSADGKEQQRTPSVSITAKRVTSKNAFSQSQYSDLLSCTLSRNTSAVEAFVDSRFELGRGRAIRFEQETGARVGPRQLFEGCFEFKTSAGTYPFDFDRLVRDWADHLGVTKEDPGTLDKYLAARGEFQITSFQGYIDCIREKNSAEAVRQFVNLPMTAAKAKSLIDLTRLCSAAPGTSLRFDVAEIDRALRTSEAD